MCDRAAPCVGIIRTFLAIDADRVYLLEHCGNGHTLKPATAPASEPPANVCGLHHAPRPCQQCLALWRRGERAVKTATAACLDCQTPFAAVGSQVRCERCRVARRRAADLTPRPKAAPTPRPCRGCDCTATVTGSGVIYCAACRQRRCPSCARLAGWHAPGCDPTRPARPRDPMPRLIARRLQDDFKAGLYGRVGLVRQAVEA